MWTKNWFVTHISAIDDIAALSSGPIKFAEGPLPSSNAASCRFRPRNSSNRFQKVVWSQRRPQEVDLRHDRLFCFTSSLVAFTDKEFSSSLWSATFSTRSLSLTSRSADHEALDILSVEGAAKATKRSSSALKLSWRLLIIPFNKVTSFFPEASLNGVETQPRRGVACSGRG